MTSFPGSSTQQPEAMLYAKETLFRDRIFITSTDDLDKVIWDRFPTAEEQQLLHKLFAVS